MSVAVVIAAVESASSSFIAGLVGGAPVVVVVSAVESVPSSFSAVVVVCYWVAAESLSSPFLAVVVFSVLFHVVVLCPVIRILPHLDSWKIAL